MARITSITRGSQNVRRHSSEVECFVQSVDDGLGGRLAHLSTFGSVDRASAEYSKG